MSSSFIDSPADKIFVELALPIKSSARNKPHIELNGTRYSFNSLSYSFLASLEVIRTLALSSTLPSISIKSKGSLTPLNLSGTKGTFQPSLCFTYFIFS